MIKAKVSRILSSLPGLKRFGSFYVGMFGSDVLLGYCLDAPPGRIYVLRFILPAYDEIRFLHLALSTEIESLAAGKSFAKIGIDQELNLKIGADWEKFQSINSATKLLNYVENKNKEGPYVLWLRLLTAIRLGDYVAADALLQTFDSNTAILPAIQQSYEKLTIIKSQSGWAGCSELLTSWAHKNKLIYCS